MCENIIEIFSSIQGEGKYVGCRQVFVRLEGCNLDCTYCDTENEIGRHPVCMVEEDAGSHALISYENPLSAQRTAEIIARIVGDVPHHSLSITGGEPLLHVPFIRELAEYVRLPLFLETNGTLDRALAECIDCIDFISMDIKLPDVLSVPVWDAHARFLAVARAKDVYVKIVVAAETADDDIVTAARIVADTAPETLLILQPVTPYGGCTAPTPEHLLAFQRLALRHVSDVRIIPQTHRMMDLL
ncbi:7-carboxy-7-deazaguanine synthase QueE [Selenomonas noxia]|jgi:radical SAM domain protein|uniref:7-carboxy-7-deazaguanine synthase QueE n=1 Tax=Selenomonas noxia TaxID=135083 RepID=UPI0028D04455|nr:7-carboxy-7-deazaguanine synthase QueE [Selenomonas noxia]